MSGINTELIGRYATGITSVINGVFVPLIFTLCILVFLFGVAKAYIISGTSDTERAKGHQLILWGIIGLVIMLSVWGLVNLGASILGFTGAETAPPLPKIPTS